jgi:glycine/betaine/sarcosine/D-proline reductase family selenoprotein B
MAKEIERAGIPVAVISALYSLALTTGSSRVIKAARIEHVCGNPRLSPEKDREYGLRIINTALKSLQTAVSGPTLFDPEESLKEVGRAS